MMNIHSENTQDLAAALAKAQAEIEAAPKDRANTFFKSSYADMASVWNACRGPLTKNGLAVTQTLDMLDNGQPVLITTLLHTSGQWVKSCVAINPVKNDPQGLGSAITYMRRYSLAAIVGVVADEDDDGNAASGNTTVAQRPASRATTVKASQSSNGTTVVEEKITTIPADWKELKARILDDAEKMARAKELYEQKKGVAEAWAILNAKNGKDATPKLETE